MALIMETTEMAGPIMITMVTTMVVKMIVLMPTPIVCQVTNRHLQQRDQVLPILRYYCRISSCDCYSSNCRRIVADHSVSSNNLQMLLQEETNRR